jgi:two-component system, chemotaxis family, protein-glutamate methylesterase/glutaminase
MAVEIVAIGASWGGLAAIECVLRDLPARFPAPVVIAQHRRRGSDGGLAELLRAHCALDVSEAEDKQALASGCVLLAPPDYHLLVEPGAVALSVDEPVHFSRPSIDVLLTSAADAYGEGAVGVVLTGANDDGAAGLAQIVARGGAAIVQDPETAARREMPEAALAAAPAAAVMALGDIGRRLADLAGAPEGAQS